MGLFSCAEFSPLRIVYISLMSLTHSLMIAGIAASSWDKFYYDLGGNEAMDAHQSLWTTYDNNAGSATYAFFKITNKVTGWRDKVVAVEMVGFSFALLCFFVMLCFIFVSKVSQNRKLVNVLSLMTVTGLIVAGSLIIYGVVYYAHHYQDNLSENAASPASQLPLYKYTLTWAPWVCVTCGGLYIVTGILVLIDTLLKIKNTNKSISPS